MNNTEGMRQLIDAMENFKSAYDVLMAQVGYYEAMNNASVNDLKGFTESYPFDKSLDELAIGQWVDHVKNGAKQPNFKVLDYQYLNTGGNTMVGIHRVWLPEEKKVVYVYTNEEGSTISTVDYIRDDLEIEDFGCYDEFHMDVVDWGRITGNEKYFELYRYCYNQYLVDDCEYFGVTRGVQYHLLSDELQSMISGDYFKWCVADLGMLVETDSKIIVTHPDYEAPEADATLQAVKDFRRWHDSIAACEEYYDKWYTLEFDGKKVHLPFIADVWNDVDKLLETTIEEW